MKTILKNIFFALAPKRLPGDRAVVLMYHSISEWDHYATVTPANFERHMAYLAAKKIPVISLSELARRHGRGEPLGGAVAVTFDDGYRDNYTAAYPILRRFGFPATVFVESGLIGQDSGGVPHLSADEMKQMSDLVECGAHTKSHAKLTALSPEEAYAEAEGSKQAVEAALGKPCTLFAYPFGNYNQSILSMVRALGFEAAVTVKEGTVGPDSKSFELPRVSIDSSTTFTQFKGKLSTAVDWYETIKVWR
jgi:peptidoglycan/xylan/chitin deacetylase (PgdA/CDA1 family)